MSQTFEGAQPQIVRDKPKYKPQPQNTNTAGFYDDPEFQQREALNIMHDKRVFRGNTHNKHQL